MCRSEACYECAARDSNPEPVLSARVLAEFGDDPDRFVDAKSRKNYAGISPITRASGTRRIVLARYARNRRLADALHQWAFCSLKGFTRRPWLLPGAALAGHRSSSRPRPAQQPPRRHPAGCLKTGTAYNEHTAWSHHTQTAA